MRLHAVHLMMDRKVTCAGRCNLAIEAMLMSMPARRWSGDTFENKSGLRLKLPDADGARPMYEACIELEDDCGFAPCEQ